jgi:hypothetical protein
LSISLLVMAGLVGSSLAVTAQAAGASATHTPATSRVAISAAQRQEMRRLYAAYRHIPLADVLIGPGSAQGAQITRTGEDLALAKFSPSPSAPPRIQYGFQDGVATGFFTRYAGQNWTMAGFGGEPVACNAQIPSSVRNLWGIGSCPAMTTARPHLQAEPDTTGTTSVIADIANSQIGITDSPNENYFPGWKQNPKGLDCDPFTTMVDAGASNKGCKTDPTHDVLDESELWCADFAKWVWSQAGVTSNLGTLNPGATSFSLWGYEAGQTMSLDSGSPQVGDAVVLYNSSVTQAELNAGLQAGAAGTGGPPGADHVGLVTEVNAAAGTMDVVNGDFQTAPGNPIQVLQTTNQTPSQYASSSEGPGEQWVFVSPQLPVASNGPAAGVDGDGNSYTFWENTSGGLEEAFYNGSSWQGPNAIKVNGNGMGPLGSEPTVAVSSNGDQYVFWEGTNQDLYEAFWNGSAWAGPNRVKDSSGDVMGPMASAPAAGIDASGNEYVFWENASGGLEETEWNGTSWTTQHAISGVSGLTSQPAVAVSSTGDQYVFWAGAGQDLYEAFWNGSTWNGPDKVKDSSGDVMGPLVSPPTAGVDGSGNEYVFWQNAAGGLEETEWNGTSWGTQHEISGMSPLGSGPSVAVTYGGSQYVFWEGTAPKQDLYEASYTGGSWVGPVDRGYGPLG